MITALVALAALARAAVLPAHSLEIQRDNKVMREFSRLHPCPDGPDKGSKVRCAGHARDHRWALECGGPDTVENLQWLTNYQHYWKTRVDNAFCRGDRFRMR